MSKFRRVDIGGDYTTPPKPESRVYGKQVTVGEPVRLEGDVELRRQIETSLEQMAKQRLLEAEEAAQKNIDLAESESRQILEKANAQAREMLAQAQAQVKAIRDAAHEEGFKAGFQEGYADATEQVEGETTELLNGAHILVNGAYEAEKRVLKDFESHAVQLVEGIVKKILRRELADSPETVLALIQKAIDSLYLSGKVRVVVSAQIIQELREFSEKTNGALDAMKRFEFVADPALDLSQIYIVGHEGSFDISPDTQVAQLLSPLQTDLKLPRPELPRPEPDAEPELEPEMEPEEDPHRRRRLMPGFDDSIDDKIAADSFFSKEAGEHPFEPTPDLSGNTDDGPLNFNPGTP